MQESIIITVVMTVSMIGGLLLYGLYEDFIKVKKHKRNNK